MLIYELHAIARHTGQLHIPVKLICNTSCMYAYVCIYSSISHQHTVQLAGVHGTAHAASLHAVKIPNLRQPPDSQL